VRVAFVGYRDFVDEEDRIVSINLTEDISAFVDFMDEIKAHGGGDQCEDVFGGLERVLTLDWKLPTKILIHVGDSPQHGSRSRQTHHRFGKLCLYNVSGPIHAESEHLSKSELPPNID
jgi:hypothetical protein